MAKLDDAIQQLRETSDQHKQMLSALHENFNQQKQILNELLHKISAMDAKYDQLSYKAESSFNHSHPGQGGTIQTRALHLDFPRLEGQDPSGWIYRAEQFFAYHQTPIT